MRKILLGALIALTSIFIYKSCSEYTDRKALLKENSMLIQTELQHVSKLIVTEGHFVEVLNYADTKELFGQLLTADKRALVVVNADVTIGYDLSQLDYTLDEARKTITIESIPEPEIKINPDFQYYDVTADYFNPFDASDYNTIKDNVMDALRMKIEASNLKSNAENRLISELSRIYLITNSMGWTLEYHGEVISDTSNFLD
ncbi:DUF4230 domain-containing protein [Muricauda sp. 2012CJ35-5]|uniref:DUF4230 domain-containing protein n=1 Tax=Flagellimonas spongiicola TaxID=2942208 RepID=A0ABT0PQK4_9FLAO|nr:DUF4230 domain-containing protein [Allomuricauda spongiicola]MCL6273670.1 DUF4230 domain-containing protein [Allomuricauda spongiicola]